MTKTHPLNAIKASWKISFQVFASSKEVKNLIKMFLVKFCILFHITCATDGLKIFESNRSCYKVESGMLEEFFEEQKFVTMVDMSQDKILIDAIFSCARKSNYIQIKTIAKVK